MIWRFLHSREPLVEPLAGSTENLHPWQAFCRLKVTLTAAGESVLQHKTDNIALNGINRWLGGVHLKGKSVPWRWDRDREALRRSSS
jgi:hypothetical protein